MIQGYVIGRQLETTEEDLMHTVFPHPTLSESVGMAAEMFEGVCTDLPPARNPVNVNPGDPKDRPYEMACVWFLVGAELYSARA